MQTTLIRDLAYDTPSPKECKRHLPAWIEKILVHRPRLACYMGIGDTLQAIETLFRTWAGERRVVKNRAYSLEPVSIDWILRKWKIVHPDDGRGEAVTYIAVVRPCVSIRKRPHLADRSDDLLCFISTLGRQPRRGGVYPCKQLLLWTRLRGKSLTIQDLADTRPRRLLRDPTRPL